MMEPGRRRQARDAQRVKRMLAQDYRRLRRADWTTQTGRAAGEVVAKRVRAALVATGWMLPDR